MAISAADRYGIGASGEANSAVTQVKRLTGVTNNTATTLFTVTIPNANHQATLVIRVGSWRQQDLGVSITQSIAGLVSIGRTSGFTTNPLYVEMAKAFTGPDSVSMALTAVSGAGTATQTFTIEITSNFAGGTGNLEILASCEVLNHNASGVTVA